MARLWRRMTTEAVYAAFSKEPHTKIQGLSEDDKKTAAAYLGGRKLGVTEIADAKEQGVLFSVHLKATMMKVSDPIIFGNVVRASAFDYDHALKKLGAPVDRGEWVMNPQLVNACNLPAMNALNFPAAILQPPDFDPARPEVMDYGSAGATRRH